MSVMTEQELRVQARRYLLKIVALFVCSYALAAAFAWIALWAEDQRGWESAIVYYAFLAAAAVPAFGVLYFGVSIWSWFQGYGTALRDLPTWTESKNTFTTAHRDVLGPIAWK